MVRLPWCERIDAALPFLSFAPEPFHIEETDTSFAIDWKGHYRIEGAAFVYTDRETARTTTVLGYPTDKLAPEE